MVKIYCLPLLALITLAWILVRSAVSLRQDRISWKRERQLLPASR